MPTLHLGIQRFRNESETQRIDMLRITLLAARFAMFLFNILAKLKGDTEISTNS